MRYITTIQSADNQEFNSPVIVMNSDLPKILRKIPGSSENPNFLTGYIFNRSPTTPFSVTFRTNRRESQDIRIEPLRKLKVKNMPCDDLLIESSETYQFYACLEYSFTVNKSESLEESTQLLYLQEYDFEQLTADELIADGETTYYNIFQNCSLLPLSLDIPIGPYEEIILKRVWVVVGTLIPGAVIPFSEIELQVYWMSGLGVYQRFADELIQVFRSTEFQNPKDGIIKYKTQRFNNMDETRYLRFDLKADGLGANQYLTVNAEYYKVTQVVPK